DLAALVIGEAVKRSKIDPASIEDVIFGHVLINGETPCIGRVAALKAGLPIEIPGYSLDRQCSSGLQAVINAALLIQTNNADVVVAGGVESMSNGEYYVTGARWGIRAGNQTFYDRFPRAGEVVSCPDIFGPVAGMIGTCENVVAEYNISREEADKFSVDSHQKAVAAIEAGRFKDEIVPVVIPQKKGNPLIIDRDEHPRADTTYEQLSKLKPVLGKTVTAGNASGMNDGAAACVLMSEEKAKELDVEPLAHLRAFAAAGVHPHYMGIGPVPAVRKCLQKAALTLQDMDLIELNEAFAGQALAVLQELGITDFSNVNVNGSGVSLGHPLGATGGRILATLLYEMRRRNARYGLETMCIGGGQGLAAIFERK
ncbi:MAG: acetyl-CoA C-acyltransferase, partial [Chloroflexi bacterium]|nr:acetyl-CoA C-acyltransferase [Chloroflexota bacterium]